MKTIWKGCAALALGLLMAQCDNKQVTTPVANAPVQSVVTNGLKIAFVEVDSLLANYQFCIDLSEEMVKKEENVRATLNDKTKKFCEVKVYTEGDKYNADCKTITVEGDVPGMVNKCRVINTSKQENKLYNVMTRDNLFNGSSSYAVVHLIDNFLVFGGEGGIYDAKEQRFINYTDKK